MRNFILILVVCLYISILPSNAINWVEAEGKTTKYVYVDIDSIKQHKNYYFYNIKTIKKNGEEVIITMQSQKTHPFCARLNYYTPLQYESLNGDYENITSNMTRMLEPVSYESRAYAAFKKVYAIMLDKNKPQITF